MKITIFPGKYHQNCGFSMAMLVYRRVVFFFAYFYLVTLGPPTSKRLFVGAFPLEQDPIATFELSAQHRFLRQDSQLPRFENLPKKRGWMALGFTLAPENRPFAPKGNNHPFSGANMLVLGRLVV